MRDLEKIKVMTPIHIEIGKAEVTFHKILNQKLNNFSKTYVNLKCENFMLIHLRIYVNYVSPANILLRKFFKI